jgi:hypothetical protein
MVVVQFGFADPVVFFPRIISGIGQLAIELKCLAPEFLDSELSVFMRQLRAQGVAGEPGRA